jgi:hypothetical protein
MGKQLPAPTYGEALLTNGCILWETNDIVAIATGFINKSSNIKTGPMIQIWILVKNSHPVEASKTGDDELICGNCSHRWFLDGGCYVNLGQAPAQVWKAYQAGSYSYDQEPYLEAVTKRKRKGRFGSYGDPAVIPVGIIQRWKQALDGDTGYTHQWLDYPELAGVFQASVDSLEEKQLANAMGFKTFRVKRDDEPLERDEMYCPADLHPDIQCIKCLKCDGKTKNIAINGHGARKKKLRPKSCN